MAMMITLLLFTLVLGFVESAASAEERHEGAMHTMGEAIKGGVEGGEAATPETFAVLDLFSEALEASVAGVGVKISELGPKIANIRDLYQNGDNNKAFAKALGVSTEIVMLGFFIEAFGIGDAFVSALSFSGDWISQLVQSVGGVMLSTKAASGISERVEEAAEAKYEHAAHATQTTTSPH